jgi:hypothetical protein
MPTNIYIYTNVFAIRHLGHILLSLTDQDRRNGRISCQPWREFTEFILLHHQYIHTYMHEKWETLVISMHSSFEQSGGWTDPPGVGGPPCSGGLSKNWGLNPQPPDNSNTAMLAQR